MPATFKSRSAFLATFCCAFGLATAAFGYFTSTGGGAAIATAGGSSSVTLHGTISGSVYPGTATTVTFTVDNPSPASQRVGTISLTKVSADASHSSCSTAIAGEKPDFTMASVAVNKTYSSGSGQAVTPTGSLMMNDTGVSQNACQGATLTLTLASN